MAKSYFAEYDVQMKL